MVRGQIEGVKPSLVFSSRSLLHDSMSLVRRSLVRSPSSECKKHGAVHACTQPTRNARGGAAMLQIVLGVLGLTSPNSVCRAT